MGITYTYANKFKFSIKTFRLSHFKRLFAVNSYSISETDQCDAQVIDHLVHSQQQQQYDLPCITKIPNTGFYTLNNPQQFSLVSLI